MAPAFARAIFKNQLPGNDLLSHTVTRAVPSALRGLTAVFGMGTGVSPSLEPPEKLKVKEQPANRIGLE
jgi:hypothetical protein